KTVNKCIDEIGTEEDIRIVNEVLEGLFMYDNHWIRLQDRMHEQSMIFLQLDKTITRGDMKKHFNRKNKEGEWLVPDEKYFPCMTRSLFTYYWYEESRKSKT
ncbi:MAG TPA: hypothetical protein VEK38_02630, partial [Candidatus Bathyarchaeia archaeon]|nr:hypothetical protein [Candidatus Bathyarchaeia archaeon]